MDEWKTRKDGREHVAMARLFGTAQSTRLGEKMGARKAEENDGTNETCGAAGSPTGNGSSVRRKIYAKTTHSIAPAANTMNNVNQFA